jgi:hypothetical protein
MFRPSSGVAVLTCHPYRGLHPYRTSDFGEVTPWSCGGSSIWQKRSRMPLWDKELEKRKQNLETYPWAQAPEPFQMP